MTHKQSYERLFATVENHIENGQFQDVKELALAEFVELQDDDEYTELHLLRYLLIGSTQLEDANFLSSFIERYEFLCTKFKDPLCQLCLDLFLARIYIRYHYYEQARYVLKRACRQSHATKHPFYISEAYKLASHVSLLLSEYTFAIQYALIGLQQLPPSSPSIFRLRLELILTKAHFHRKTFDQARKLLQRLSHSFLKTTSSMPIEKSLFMRLKAYDAHLRHQPIAAEVYGRQSYLALFSANAYSSFIDQCSFYTQLATEMPNKRFFEELRTLQKSFSTQNVHYFQIDQLARKNIAKQLEKDTIGTSPFNEQLGIYTTNGIFEHVNEWFNISESCACCVITAKKRHLHESTFHMLLKLLKQHCQKNARIVIGQFHHQLILFEKNTTSALLKDFLQPVLSDPLFERHAFIYGFSERQQETTFAQQLYNIAYADLYYKRQIASNYDIHWS